MPTKLRRYLETENRGGQLHVLNGSVHYKVTYSQGGIWWTMIQKHLHLHSAWLRGHQENFLVNLGYGGMCLETVSAFPNQDL